MKINLLVATFLSMIFFIPTDGICNNFEDFFPSQNFAYGNPENTTTMTEKDQNISQTDLSLARNLFLLGDVNKIIFHPNSNTQLGIAPKVTLPDTMRLNNIFSTDEEKIFFDPTLEVPLGNDNFNVFGGYEDDTGVVFGLSLKLKLTKDLF